MATSNLTVEIRLAWWFTWLYLPLLHSGSWFGLEPKPEALKNAINLAVKCKRKTNG